MVVYDERRRTKDTDGILGLGCNRRVIGGWRDRYK